MQSQIRLPFKDADVRRKDKGRKKPQAVRQAKSRTQALVNKLIHNHDAKVSN